MVVEKYRYLVMELENRSFEDKISFLKLLFQAERNQTLQNVNKIIKTKLIYAIDNHAYNILTNEIQKLDNSQQVSQENADKDCIFPVKSSPDNTQSQQEFPCEREKFTLSEPVDQQDAGRLSSEMNDKFLKESGAHISIPADKNIHKKLGVRK